MNRRDLLLAFSAALLTTAESAPRGEYVAVDSKLLKRTDAALRVRLNEALVWSRKSNGTEFGLLPGEYESQMRDADAQFFVGQEATCYMRTVRGEYLVAPGGLWLPTSVDVRPRFFIVQQRNTLRRGSTLAEAVAATPAQPLVFSPGIGMWDAVIQWASEGQMMLLPEVDEPTLIAAIGSAFNLPRAPG